MEFIKFVITAIIFGIVILVVKNQEKEIGTLLSIACSLVLLASVINSATSVVSQLSEIFENAQVDTTLLKSVLKIIGVAYIAEFGSDICKESGGATLATKVSLFGKITVLSQTLPLISNFISIIGNLL